MKIAEFSVKNSQFTFIIFLAVMALGIGSLLNMPRAEDPKFIAPGFTIIMVYPGAGPSEIENKITDKVEARLWALGDIDRMRSASANGIGVVTMEFKHGQDPDKKYEEVLREINAARPELPELYRLEIQRFSASDVAMLQIGLVSENASWAQLRAEAERLEERLERIPGMKGADVWGFPKREVRISLNLPRMAAEGVPASRIFGALQSENVSIPGGSVNVGERQFSVETSGDYESIEEVRNTIINVNGGKILYLKDLAEVEFAYEEPRHLTRTNGVRSVFVTARMKDEQNIFNVGEDAYRALDEFKAALPPNVDMVKIFDQNDSVVKRLSRFAKDFGIAIALVLLTLLPLGWRAATVVMISIPLSISIGLFAMDKLGYSLNQLSIVGLIIALGILVDDAIVVVENIERWLRDGYKRRDAAILATKQIGLAVLGCTATLILAFLPLVYLPEAAGDFIRSLPMAVVTTVIASLFVSLTIVPFLGSRMLAEHHDPRGNIFLRGLKWLISKSYAKLLHVGLRNPRWTMFFSALIFFGVLSLAGRAGFSVFPASERPMFLIDIEMAAGTNLEKTNAIAQMVDSVLLTYSVDGGRLTADGDEENSSFIAHHSSFTGSAVILATGHSARDIYKLLSDNKLRLENKPFALGIRIEHPQPLIDQIQYRQSPRDPDLPASSYSLVCQVRGRGVFSFCMCPGGLVVPAATAPGEIVVNGMSMSRRDSPYANSGMVTSVEAEDLADWQKHGVFAGLEFQKSVEQRLFAAGDGSQKAPAVRLPDFLRGKISASLPGTSYIPGLFAAPLHELLPPFIYKRLRDGLAEFGKTMRGFYTEEANVIGTESRTSAPVRIPRDAETLMHPDALGLFPCGEGAGFAGGIISAAMDGQRVARAVGVFVRR